MKVWQTFQKDNTKNMNRGPTVELLQGIRKL